MELKPIFSVRPVSAFFFKLYLMELKRIISTFGYHGTPLFKLYLMELKLYLLVLLHNPMNFKLYLMELKL